MSERLVSHFREQARFCEAFGSPFTAALVDRMGDDLAAGGPVAALVGGWSGHPRKDALSLRLAGALHEATLSGRDADLAARYPAACPTWRIEDVWPAARDFLAREHVWVSDFIQLPPQTNETRRAIALLAGFLHHVAEHPGPIDVLEIGASAGLNVAWDRFRYETASWEWGAASPLVIDTDWRALVPPVEAPLVVRHRAACDLAPLDVSDPIERRRLRAYVWADQRERLARFDAAASLAVETGVRVERAEAGAWLAERLPGRARDVATVVYHSVFLQYPPRERREAIASTIAEAGASATASAPLVWLRLEPEAVLGGPVESIRMLLDWIIWPGGERRVLAVTDGHVRAVDAA